MPRINVEDTLFSDYRFLELTEKQGRFAAGGMILFAWKLAQKYFLENDGFIPFEVWERAGMTPVLECGLAEKSDRGVYVKGTNEQFAWLKQRQLAGKRSAAERNATKRNETQRNATDEHGTQPLTLSLPLSLSKNTEYSGGALPPRTHKKKISPLADEVFNAYALSIERVYGEKPEPIPRARKMCQDFIDCVGVNRAVELAKLFPLSKHPFHVKGVHSLGVMLADYQTLVMAYDSGNRPKK